MTILQNKKILISTGQYRRYMRRVQVFSVVVMIFISCGNGVDDQYWEESSGMKRREMIRPLLAGTWTGDHWNELVISYANGDSVAGCCDRVAVRFRGVIRGIRADVAGYDEDLGEISGYLLRKTGTDTLFVGLRDSSETWCRFFTMVSSDVENNHEKD